MKDQDKKSNPGDEPRDELDDMKTAVSELLEEQCASNSSDDARTKQMPARRETQAVDDQATEFRCVGQNENQATKQLPVHGQSSDTAHVQTGPHQNRTPEENVPTMAVETVESGSTAAPGIILGNRYRLVAKVADGGMGSVFKAVDNRREDAGAAEPFVAVKFIRADRHDIDIAHAALQREFARLLDLVHPNVVRVFDFDRYGDRFFLVMEWLEGETLARSLGKKLRQQPTKFEALKLIEGMGTGLAYVHESGTVHADIKPSNIFLTDSGQVKLLDFGNIPDNDTHSEIGSGSFWMTPSFATCEVLEGHPAAPTDDVFAMACIAQKLLTGAHPFGRLDALDAEREGRRPSDILCLSESRRRAIRRSLAFRAENRTVDAIEFMDRFFSKDTDAVLPDIHYPEELHDDRADEDPRAPVDGDIGYSLADVPESSAAWQGSDRDWREPFADIANVPDGDDSTVYEPELDPSIEEADTDRVIYIPEEEQDSNDDASSDATSSSKPRARGWQFAAIAAGTLIVVTILLLTQGPNPPYRPLFDALATHASEITQSVTLGRVTAVPAAENSSTSATLTSASSDEAAKAGSIDELSSHDDINRSSVSPRAESRSNAGRRDTSGPTEKMSADNSWLERSISHGSGSAVTTIDTESMSPWPEYQPIKTGSFDASSLVMVKTRRPPQFGSTALPAYTDEEKRLIGDQPREVVIISDTAIHERFNQVPLQLVDFVKPAYPMHARRTQQSGSVDVTFVIGRDGRPRDIRILESQPSGVFESASTNALQQWQYAPADAGRTHSLRFRYVLTE